MRKAMAATVLLLAIGCAGDGRGGGVATLAGDDPSATPSASVDPEDALRKFAQCMREHGVDLPDPGQPGQGQVVLAPTAAPQRVQEAEAACGHLLKAAVGEGPAPDDPAMQDRALKFARCMREHGVDLPDPGSDGAIRKRAGDGGDLKKPPFDPADPKFRAAEKACGDLFGGAGVTREGP